MEWPFCRCGALLEPTDTRIISCTTCGIKLEFASLQINEVITQSSPRSKPGWLLDTFKNNDEKEGNEHVIIEEPCPKCGHPEQYFYKMQLRSVDEGSTVFFECPKCNNKYSINN